MEQIISSAIGQGLLWAILSLGLFISFRILNMADMTTEGAFPLGAGVCVVALKQGYSPLVACLMALVAGGLAGWVTGWLITTCGIPSLLAGILSMTALLSVNLRIMNSPNLPLLNIPTIFSPFESLGLPVALDRILLGLILLCLIIGLMVFFFHTELGQALIATGDNPKMAAALGISTQSMTILGLVLSNALVALAGAVLAQNNGYADVNSGMGTIVIALAAIIIGEVLFAEVSFSQRLVCIVYGSILYRLLLTLVLMMDFFKPTDFKLISAALIAFCLSIPKLRRGLRLTTKGGGNQ